MGWLTKIGAFIRRILGLILPLFSKARDFPKMAPGLRTALHIGLILLILVVLWWLNGPLKIPSLVGARAPQAVANLYLPILFLLVYGMSWLGWWLWKLLWADDDASLFPDIDAAWAEAVAALNQQGLDVRDAPLFLILGRPAGGEAAVFQAAQLQFPVQMEPRRSDAPLRVWANPDGIYVTCAGASLSGRFARLLTDKDRSNAEFLAEDFDPYKTLPPQGRLREVQSILAQAHAEGRRPDQLTDEERAQICELVGERSSGNTSERSGVRTPKPNLLKDHDEVERCVARLRHLCKLVARDRRPFCPINGVLALVSLTALTDDDLAGQAATVYQLDLTGARQELQLICPVFAVVCDLESSPGFAEFLSRFPGEQRFGRLGHRFPLASELDANALPTQIEAMANWICRSVVPAHVYKLFQVENVAGRTRAEGDEIDLDKPAGIDQIAVVRGNSELYQFLVHVRRTSRNLARVLKGGVISDSNQKMLFGGCYLSGTGSDARNGQGFVAGVFRRLKQCEDSVSWTPEAFAEEAEAGRWTQWGYIVLGCVVVGVILAVIVRMALT